MSAITEGQIITPNKKNIIIDALNQEIKNLNDAVRNQQLDEVIKGSFGNTRMQLQKILNTILEKKGVITPDETTEIVKKIDEAKKQRLADNYVMGMKKGVFYALALIAIGGGIYWYIQKNKL